MEFSEAYLPDQRSSTFGKVTKSGASFQVLAPLWSGSQGAPIAVLSKSSLRLKIIGLGKQVNDIAKIIVSLSPDKTNEITFFTEALIEIITKKAKKCSVM
jgi:hypothetical protein